MSEEKPKKELTVEESVNIFVVGCGGQGVIVASDIICDAAVRAGLEAKKSEVHGMAQRGGAVSTHVRIGHGITSPLISQGDADVILAFEQAEALRWTHFVKPGGVMIANTQKIIPPIAVTLGLQYPDEAGFAILGSNNVRLIKLDAFDWALSLGDGRFVNTILLGVLSALPEMQVIPHESWVETIGEVFAKKMMQENIKAFEEGQKYQPS